MRGDLLLPLICKINFSPRIKETMKKKLLIVIIIFIGSLFGCVTHKNNIFFIELGKPEILEEHSLEMPNGAISLSIVKVFELEGKPFLLTYFYPKYSLYIYDLSNDSLIKQVNLNGIISVNNVEFFNRDSIMVYGTSYNFENDSNIRCINLEGEIKHVYSLHQPNIISSKNLAENLIPNKSEMYPRAQFINDNKIFISFDYPYYGVKGYQKKYPLVGYYDLIKDSLVINYDIWYPEIPDNRYYKQSIYYRHSISLNNNGNIIISFSHTPIMYEWNYKSNIIYQHKVLSKFMTAIPYTDSLQKDESEYNNYDVAHGQYFPGVYYIMKNNTRVNFRDLMLPANKYGDNTILRVFFDSKYQYLGEMIMSSDYFINKYKDTYYSCLINNGRLDFKFIKPTFKSFDENRLKAKLDSIEKAEIEKKNKKNKELCLITGDKRTLYTYQQEDIVKYLQKTQQIEDTSFSVAILNKFGCGPCNDYVLQFLNTNQAVLFNIKSRPLYVLYVSEGSHILEIESYLNGYSLSDKKHVKLDNSELYKKFNPYTELNPRLVFVSHNKVVFDHIYMPNELENFVADLIKHYGLETE